MIKTVMKINGMVCGMCEAHINDVIRRTVSVKKVSTRKANGESVIISENEIDIAKLREAIEKTGYRVLSVATEQYEKKAFL